MKVYIYPNLSKTRYIETVTKVVNTLMTMKDVECVFSKEDCEVLFHHQKYCSLTAEQADLIVSVGGDGTLLKAAKLALQYDLPIAGINAGRKGFLCKYKVEEFLHLTQNPFNINDYSNRDVLSMIVEGKEYLAVNDFVFSSRNAGYTIEATLQCKTHHIVYMASGFIVATPTGSTAYNVAAGGSVVDANLHATIITPICACGEERHSYVISAHDAITISNDREFDPIDVYCDGGFVCEMSEPLSVVASSRNLKLLQ